MVAMVSSVGSATLPYIPPAQSRGVALGQPPAEETSPTPSVTKPSEDQRALNALQEATAATDKDTSPFNTELSEEEEKIVDDLKQTDQEVRAHEQAHKSAGGAYAGAIQFETVTGPDGRKYAVGGEVPIDATPIANNPAATIQKMDIVIRAALAPAQPSSQDFSVARAAQQARAQAQKELLEQQKAENSNAPSNTAAAVTAGTDNLSADALSSEQQDKLARLIQGLEQAQTSLSRVRGFLLNVNH